MRRRSLMVPASASTPTLISGSANFACSSITMMSVPSTISKPPPQAMPLTAAMRGLSRLRGWFKPPNPPAPQSSSDSSPAAAPFRSQPGLKKRAPEVGGSVSRGGERGLDERRDIAGRAAAVAGEEPGDPQLPDRSGDRGRAEGRQQAHAVAQQLGEHPAGAEREQLPELRIDADADQNLGDTIAHHVLDQHRGGDRGEPLRGRGGLGGRAHVEDDRAQLSSTAPARSSASSASRWPCSGTMPRARHRSRVARDSDSGRDAITALRTVAPGSAAAKASIALT